MYKILVTTMKSQSLDGGASVCTEVIDFENAGSANIAVKKINDKSVAMLNTIGIHQVAIALFEDLK